MDNPVCCYCNNAPSEEVDHCPPRAYFASRTAPFDYEFPSCMRCNRGTSHADLVVSALFAVSITEGDKVSEEQQKRLNDLVRRAPEVAEEITNPVSRNETRRKTRSMFGQNADLVRAAGYQIANTGVTTKRHIVHFGEKLTRALFYKHVGRPLQSDGRTLVLPFASPLLIPEMERVITKLPAYQPSERNKVDLSPQFSYRYNCDPVSGVFAALVILGDQFGYLVIALPVAHWEQLKSISEVFRKLIDEQKQALLGLEENASGSTWRL